MGFLSIFRKSQNVSVIPLNGIIAPNMGRRKGLNLNEIDKNIEDAFSAKNLKVQHLFNFLNKLFIIIKNSFLTYYTCFFCH